MSPKFPPQDILNDFCPQCGNKLQNGQCLYCAEKEVGPIPPEQPLERTSEQAREAVLDAFREFGFESPSASILERLRQIEQKSTHFQDAHEMAKLMSLIAEEMEYPPGRSPQECAQQFRFATLIHDIGKSGPAHDGQFRDLVINLFALGKKDIPSFPPDKRFRDMPVGEIVTLGFRPDHPRNRLKGHPERMNEDLKALGVEPTGPMIDFYNRHSQWGLEILRGENLDEETILIASGHHFLDGISPDPNLTLEELFQKVEQLKITEPFCAVGVIDKYQAYRRRGGLTHLQAMKALKEFIQKAGSTPSHFKESCYHICDLLDQQEQSINSIIK